MSDDTPNLENDKMTRLDEFNHSSRYRLMESWISKRETTDKTSFAALWVVGAPLGVGIMTADLLLLGAGVASALGYLGAKGVYQRILDGADLTETWYCVSKADMPMFIGGQALVVVQSARGILDGLTAQGELAVDYGGSPVLMMLAASAVYRVWPKFGSDPEQDLE